LASKLAFAEQHFNSTYVLGFIVCTGHQYLGGFIGDSTSRNEYVSSKISSWTQTVQQLSLVASEKYSHSAYTGYTKSLQHQWTFLQRVVPDIDNLFKPLEDMISSSFLQTLFGASQDSCRDLQTLLALPVKLAGLAIPNPVSTCASNYQNLTVMSSHLLLTVQEQFLFSFQAHHDTCKAALQGTRAGKLLTNESTPSKFLSSLFFLQQMANPLWHVLLEEPETLVCGFQPSQLISMALSWEMRNSKIEFDCYIWKNQIIYPSSVMGVTLTSLKGMPISARKEVSSHAIMW
jgi:hypothetical protein